MSKKAYIKQAGVELGFTEYQLRRMAKEGKIPYLKSGNRYVFDIEQVEEFLRNKAVENMKHISENVVQHGVLRKCGI